MPETPGLIETQKGGIPFTKMHGLGNDFVVFDNRSGQVPCDKATLRQLADRHLGIGCDQILMVTSPHTDEADFGYAIYNANGQAVGQCGNGARCLAHFIHHHNISNKPSLSLHTTTTAMTVTKLTKNIYSVDMPAPSFEISQLPFTPLDHEAQPPYALSGFDAPCYIANVGNPHAIFIEDEVRNQPSMALAKALSEHIQFPEQANISFMKIHDPDHISLTVYERGSGPTLACGSAACAAMAVGKHHLSLTPEVRVTLPGGDLSVSWEGGKNPLKLSGPSEIVFEGIWPQK